MEGSYLSLKDLLSRNAGLDSNKEEGNILWAKPRSRCRANVAHIRQEEEEEEEEEGLGGAALGFAPGDLESTTRRPYAKTKIEIPDGLNIINRGVSLSTCWHLGGAALNAARHRRHRSVQSSTGEPLLHRNMKRFRGGLVFKANRPV